MRSLAKPLSYSTFKLIETPIRAKRQGARRHYGVHPYFTRRPYNVVSKYILQYTREGDRVLDPFGGSGVTAIEAFLENRIGIQNDINPLANFIASGIANLRRGSIAAFNDALAEVERACLASPEEDAVASLLSIATADEAQLNMIQAGLILLGALPLGTALPKTSDVPDYYQLFSRRQLLSLAVLKHSVDSLTDRDARNALLLAWSATLTKLNKTFLSAEGRAESRGGSSIFSIYRYKVAKNPVELPVWETFKERAENVKAAKDEIIDLIRVKESTQGWCGEFIEYSKDIEDLSAELEDSVDYIFTDPPYGGHISYLDLSTLWNHWLGFTPSESVRRQEMIVGGDLDISEPHYIERLGASIKACLRMLKQGRWLSVVFQHWNVAYFNAILTAAAEGGAELKAAVSQIGDPIWSMHKKKNRESVLAGELILTFFKDGRSFFPAARGAFDLERSLSQLLEEVERSGSRRVFGEYLLNRLVIEAWRSGTIESIDIKKEEFSDLLMKSGWRYEQTEHCWTRNGDHPESLLET